MNLDLSAFSKFSRDTKLLLLVAALSSLSFYGINVLLKVLYVLRLGFGPEYLGLFVSVGAMTYMGMGIPSGALGGRYGPNRMMIVGGVIASVGMVVLALAEFFTPDVQSLWLITMHVFLIVGWALFNVNLVPALKNVTTEENVKSAYAVSGAMRSLGTFLGAIFGGILPGVFTQWSGQTVDDPSPYRFALWVGAGLMLVSLIPLLFARQGEQTVPAARNQIYGRFPLWPIIFISVHCYLVQMGWASSHAFFNAYMDTELGQPVSVIGVINGVAQFASILAPLFILKLAEKRGNAWVIVLMTAGIAVGLVPLAMFSHWGTASAGRLIMTATWSTWLPTLQVYQMDLVDERWRALAYGIASMAMGFGFGTSSFVGGYIIAAKGYPTLFALGIVASLGASGLMWLGNRRFTEK